MRIIKKIRVAGFDLDFTPALAAPYKGFFEVDSITAIIGKNGSGKTTALADIAKLVSDHHERKTRWYSEDRLELEDPAQYQNDVHGVIYFSPIPYRRQFPRRKNCINASPSFSGISKLDDYDLFEGVTKQLGVNSELRGVIKYSRRVLEERLLAALTDKTVEITSDPINDIVLSINRLTDNTNESSVDQTKIKNYRVELLKLLFEEITHRNPYSRNDINGLLIIYASLEAISKTIKDSNPWRTFLESCQIIQTRNPSNSYARTVNRVSSLINHHIFELEEFLSAAHNIEIDPLENCLTFRITSINQANDIVRAKVPIKLIWSNLSSGLWALVDQFCKIRKAAKQLTQRGYKDILLLVDEGDVYLHLEWQRQYLKLLDQFLGGLKRDLYLDSFQVILATHSPLIASDLPSEMLINLDAPDQNFNSFASSIESVIFNSFNSSAIGEFAVQKINQLHQKLKNGQPSDSDFALIEKIGDSGIRNILTRIKQERFE